MTIAILDDFRRRLIHEYRLEDIHIYSGTEPAAELLAGGGVSEILLKEYTTFGSPKYIVREDGKDLRHAVGVRSRFVWNTAVNGSPFLVVIDSARRDAFDTSAKKFVDEIQQLKEVLER